MNVDNLDVFSCCYEIKGLFPVSRIQPTSRCPGAGREYSQAGSPSWPAEIFRTIDGMLSLGMEVGRGA